jgi:phytoene dehydrogenase-like protein
MEKSIIIIGAGIAGLAAGCYAQMNGYRTQIFEMHARPGGLCTAWSRRGRNTSASYAFDGCIHHLAGCGPNSQLYPIWEELGAVQGRKMLYREAFAQVEDADGRAFTVYVDPDRLEQHVSEFSPGDAVTIKKYADGVRRFTHFEFFSVLTAGPRGMIAMLPHVPTLIKWGRIKLEDYAQRFTNPFLQKAFPWIQYDFPDVPAMINLAFLAGCHNQQLGWPVGGAAAFSQAIADRYVELGGEIHYKSRVEKVLVKDDRAVGVRLVDGTEHHADTVISAADGHTTIFDMLDGQYTSDKIHLFYNSAPESQEMNLHVSLGVARDLSHEPHMLTLLLKQPMEIMGKKFERLDAEIFGFETQLAPRGKTAIKVLLKASYDYWKVLRVDRARYEEEKQQVAETVIDRLAQRFPGLKAQIEVVDVATPLTIERYTGNYHGFQAWGLPGASPLAMMKGLSKTLPGLENFYMVGQWALASIGLSTVAVAARKLIQELCKRDRRRFTTSV